MNPLELEKLYEKAAWLSTYAYMNLNGQYNKEAFIAFMEAMIGGQKSKAIDYLNQFTSSLSEQQIEDHAVMMEVAKSIRERLTQ